ncbi:hypothetical protein GCM10010399_82660 [Dactylosporangium fulvum]|uniref:DUF1090 domain-containing protein n=1 Tax=Dactylosporangium fulvum TaxID=53359 RepID=A0ABY5W768_9ACTN|nr:DUF1090 domain-containing protein [Dactylosporangium fulvum]UWP85863.1 DUF1090 domain-containing protein [Dactylosporangium fulvum]
MRHATPDDNTEKLHPVATDQPGLILHNPYRKLRQIAVVYALLPLLCAGVGGWIATQIAYTRAADHTDARIEALERDLSERRTTNQQANAERDRQIAELRRLVCILADHAQPRDGQIEQVRGTYGCTGGPYPVPSVSTAPPARPGPGLSRTTAGALPPAVRSSPARAPLPSPAGRPPSPSPAPSGGPLLCIDLPLLPPICL